MTRVISGAVLLVGVLAALWFLPPMYLLGLAVVVALLAFREYVDIAARAGASVSKPAAGVATALVCVAVGAPDEGRVEQTRQLDVVHVAALAAEKARVFRAADGGSEVLGAHGDARPYQQAGRLSRDRP